MNSKNILFLLIVLLSLSSCASYRAKYKKSEKDWLAHSPVPGSAPEYTVYLVGDAGHLTAGKKSPSLRILKEEVSGKNNNSTVIFLGDNIYPRGFPPKSDTLAYHHAQMRMDTQLCVLEKYGGQTFFIPGNHDWYYDGLKSVKREEIYVENALMGADAFRPSDGCGGPELVTLTDEVVLIMIDSEWYIEDWDKHPGINDNCVIKSREESLEKIRELVHLHKDKYIIFALHHPIASYCRHGGYYTLKEHIFPLTFVNKHLYVPLPVIGTLVGLIGKLVGIPQDISYPSYKRMIKGIREATEGAENIVFVSGHDHALQYLEKKGQKIVVSGTGSKKNPVARGKYGYFTYGEYGYARLDFYPDETVWVTFTTENEAKEAEVVYRKKIK